MRYLSLNKKTGIWTLRRQIPKDLQTEIGKTELKQSLGHCSQRDAESKAYPYLTQWDRQIEQAKNNVRGNKVHSVSTDPLPIKKAKDRQADHIEEVRASSGGNPKDYLKQHYEFFEEAVQKATLIAKGLPVEYDTLSNQAEVEEALQAGIAAGYIIRSADHLSQY